MDSPPIAPFWIAQIAAVTAAGGAGLARTLRARRVRPVAVLLPLLPLLVAPAGAIGVECIVRTIVHVAAHRPGLPALGGVMAYGALAAYAGAQAALAPRGLRWEALGDAVGPLACLVAFGRIGCLCAGCEPGVMGPLGLRHPVAIYEGAVALLGWWLAGRAERWLPARREARFAAFAAVYAIGRAAIEVLRDPGPLTGGGVTIAQHLSAATLFGLALALLGSGGRERPRP